MRRPEAQLFLFDENAIQSANSGEESSMRPRKRSGYVRLLVQAVEVLEARTLLSASALGSAATNGVVANASVASQSIVSHLAAAPNLDVSTVPANGDQNPYGVAFVPQGVPGEGKLQAGDVLVSNFNNSDNQQGTGTTIVEISPSGQQTLFFQGPKGLGLTTGLTVLKSGFVLVGNVPTSNGTFSTIQQGSLLILDKNGQVVANLTNKAMLDGPWDMTVYDAGSIAFVFVSNVLNGTVTRIELAIPPVGKSVHVLSTTRIATGFAHRGDPTALALGPTGLAFDPMNDLLYVASTADNAIYSISNALFRLNAVNKGTLVFSNPNLRGPLGLVLLPDGNLIASNGDAVNGNPADPSELVEFTPTGKFIGESSVDPAEGGAFGIAVESNGDDVVFAAVDDNTNTLKVWDFEL
jgi:sugar lactone lactonase YvrE